MFVTLLCFNHVQGQTEVSDSSVVDTTQNVLVLDTVNSDSIILKPATLRKSNNITTIINYNAKDSIIMDVINQKAYLYGEAHVDYGKIILEAAYIEIDWEKSEVFAKGMPDSTQKDTIGLPFFKEGSEEFVAKEMRYNFKTEKGIIKEVVTQEGEAFIHGKKIKINEKKELFINDAVYTTCNLEHPHFAIVSKKIKIVPDKLAVTGPFNLMISDVNTPIGGPFGLFPLPKEKTSGFIMPTYGETSRTGFFLRDMGYYLAVSDYLGLKLTGDIYTNSSWRVSLESDYKKRYKYEGKTQIALTRLKSGFDETTEKTPLGYKIYWSHKPQGTRNGKLTSSVNMQSANYNKENRFDVNYTLRNNFTSSISYSKNFGKGPFSMNLSLRQDQKDSIQNFTLPEFTLNMSRIQPLKKLPGKSSVWYKKIGISYKMNLKNKLTNLTPVLDARGIETGTSIIEQIDFLNINNLQNKSSNGIKHSIPLTLPSFKVFKHFTLTPAANYNEYWYPDRLKYSLIDTSNSFVSYKEKGFNRAYDYQTSLSLNTRLYGYFNIPFLGIQRIKHTATPKITYVYKPDFADSTFNQKFYQSELNNDGVLNQLNRFQGYVMGGPSKGRQQTVGFDLTNVFDARIRNKKDTSNAPTYIKLLDNYSLRSSYNFAADSLNLAPLSMSARATVQGVVFNVKSTHDFYDYTTISDGVYKRVNTIKLKNGWIEPRLTSFNVSASTDLNPKKRQKKYEPKNEQEELELEYIQNNSDNYVDFDIPWSLNIAYNIDWKRQFEQKSVTQSLKVNGNVSLTPKWKFTFSNVGYDFVKKEKLQPQVGIIRDLHCWEMRFKYRPFGVYRGYTFDINVKAQVLQSLKLSKQDNHTNY